MLALFSFGVRALVSAARSGATCIKDKRTHHRHNPNFVIFLTVKKWMEEVRPKEEILKTERQIRFELSVIKWYYTQLAQGKTNVNVSDSRLPNFPQLLADYKAAIQIAPRPVQRLWQDMYLSGTNPTQKQLAEQWCVTEKYVQILNKRLLKYIRDFRA